MEKYFILNGSQKVIMNQNIDKKTVELLFKSFSLDLCQVDLLRTLPIYTCCTGILGYAAI